MGIWDFLSAFMKSAAKTTANQRADFARKFEKDHPDMDSETRKKFDAFNAMTDKMADISGTYASSSTTDNARANYLGKTVEEWDCEWISIGMLKDADLSPYNHCVGLYRHVIGSTTKYVGRAIELNNGGFRKRLSDYRRESNSARKHSSGRTIYEHLDEIETYILIIGDTLEAVEATRKLEGQFVRKYNPEWNRQINI